MLRGAPALPALAVAGRAVTCGLRCPSVGAATLLVRTATRWVPFWSWHVDYPADPVTNYRIERTAMFTPQLPEEMKAPSARQTELKRFNPYIEEDPLRPGLGMDVYLPGSVGRWCSRPDRLIVANRMWGAGLPWWHFNFFRSRHFKAQFRLQYPFFLGGFLIWVAIVLHTVKNVLPNKQTSFHWNRCFGGLTLEQVAGRGGRAHH